MTDFPTPSDDPLESVFIPAFEETQLTRSEYIAAMVHFYRGELHRSTMWRMRLDTTTNWSIISVMALVTFSLGDPTHSHVGILGGMVLVFTFLTIEARRFRFFDVWRARTRMLEENFIGAIVKRDLKSPVENWGKMVADDLLRPRFKVTWHQALKARLLRNYAPLFMILLASWILKICMPLNEDLDKTAAALSFAKSSILPPWISIAFVAILYGYLLTVVAFARRTRKAEEEYWQTESKQLGDLDT